MAAQSQYRLSLPDRMIELPLVLREISGIALGADKWYAVQDEKGVIFELDPTSGKIAATFTFWKDGDYEGIEVVGQTIYVLKSSGTIYEINQLGKPDQAVKKYNGFISSDYDAEGLAYHPDQNCLLIACKARGEEAADWSKRQIFQFNLTTKTFEPQPYLTIDRMQILDYLAVHSDLPKWDKLHEFFSERRSDYRFGPSAIAIHPISKHCYLLSANGRVLLEFNEKGEIIQLQRLSKKIHPQAEGLTFLPDGTMLISNEAKGEMARILVYHPK